MDAETRRLRKKQLEIMLTQACRKRAEDRGLNFGRRVRLYRGIRKVRPGQYGADMHGKTRGSVVYVNLKNLLDADDPMSWVGRIVELVDELDVRGTLADGISRSVEGPRSSAKPAPSPLAMVGLAEANNPKGVTA